MTDQYVLSIDPGKSSGIALLAYNDREVWLEGAWQFKGGVKGLLGWLNSHTYEYIEGAEVFTLSNERKHGKPLENSHIIGRSYSDWRDRVMIISEKFTARNTQGFSYTTDSLEPLRGEGALIALGLMPDYTPNEKRWRDPKLQYLVGGRDKADKKKRLHRFLKESGFYVAPSAVDGPDADDVRSALGQALAYLQREVKHRGVHNMVTKWIEEN